VPFNELASLGGNAMPGFVAGWMTGRGTFAAQLGYSWPVWTWLGGQTRFAVGNAFGSHLDDLSGAKLRLSGDLGVAWSASAIRASRSCSGSGPRPCSRVQGLRRSG
jgi:hypothetical protein